MRQAGLGRISGLDHCPQQAARPSPTTTSTLIWLWVEDEATQLKAKSPAGTVKLSKQKESVDGYKLYKVTFPQILKGQTRTITATYVIKGGAARAVTSTRVNGAYVNFAGISQPTDAASVKVIVPSSFASSTWGGKVKTTTKGKQTIHSSGNIKNPRSYWVGVNGTNPEGTSSRPSSHQDPGARSRCKRGRVTRSGSGRDVECVRLHFRSRDSLSDDRSPEAARSSSARWRVETSAMRILGRTTRTHRWPLFRRHMPTPERLPRALACLV